MVRLYGLRFKFNNAQRAHLNFVEQIATCLALIAVGGLFYPIVQASFGLVMFIARIVYTVGYIKGGPKGRAAGVILWDIGLIASLVLASITAIQMIMGKNAGS